MQAALDDTHNQLVIFDCDGVLVDSEPIAISVLQGALAGSGLVLDTGTTYDLFLGRSMANVVAILENEFDLRFSINHLDALRSQLYGRLQCELKAIEGVREVIEGLNMKTCVATSSQMERARLSLKITNLLELFDPRLYSAAQVKRGKPAPDLFLFAANNMSVSPDQCIVIEDSPAGVEAAKAAGMRVFAFLGGSHAEPGKLHQKIAPLSPDAVFYDMRELPRMLDRVMAGEAPA